MSGEINVSIRRGVIKVTAEIPLTAGAKCMEAFVDEIAMNILGYTVDREKPQQRSAEPVRAPEKPSGIPRSGLLNKNQVLEVLGIKRSTLDNRIRAGLFPKGGKDCGRRVWNAEDVWATVESLARGTYEPKKTPWLRRTA